LGAGITALTITTIGRLSAAAFVSVRQRKVFPMFEYTENKSKAIELARQCLSASTNAMEPLSLYNFEDDLEAHDEELQGRLEVEFHDAWQFVTDELTRVFGPAAVAESEEEVDWVPLCGVGGASWWETSQGRLWVAYAHEDRETPYLLMVGSIRS
jgi:hypothetical protein